MTGVQSIAIGLPLIQSRVGRWSMCLRKEKPSPPPKTAIAIFKAVKEEHFQEFIETKWLQARKSECWQFLEKRKLISAESKACAWKEGKFTIKRMFRRKMVRIWHLKKSHWVCWTVIVGRKSKLCDRCVQATCLFISSHVEKQTVGAQKEKGELDEEASCQEKTLERVDTSGQQVWTGLHAGRGWTGGKSKRSRNCSTQNLYWPNEATSWEEIMRKWESSRLQELRGDV